MLTTPQACDYYSDEGRELGDRGDRKKLGLRRLETDKTLRSHNEFGCSLRVFLSHHAYCICGVGDSSKEGRQE